MPTARRLINKRAYDEMVLIQEFLDMQFGKYNVKLELDENRKERFTIYNGDEYFTDGKNYTEIMKKMTEFFASFTDDVKAETDE